MQTLLAPSPESQRYAKIIENSQRVRWHIDRDVIRGREFDFSKTFLPAGLSLVDELAFLTPGEARLMSQVQGRTYAYLFGLVERFIGAKMAEVSHGHALGDQLAFEALVRFTDEEIKHQELFRRIGEMMAAGMPQGYVQTADANAVAGAVLSKSTWSVLALTCHIELFVLAHYRASIHGDEQISPLWKDVFLFHWREESQHAVLDEMEWLREDAHLSDAQRDAAVGDFIALVGAVDGLLQGQAEADATYFISHASRAFSAPQAEAVRAAVLKAYRWQYIVSGAIEPRFQKVLSGLLSPAQMGRVREALQPLTYAVPMQPPSPQPLAA